VYRVLSYPEAAEQIIVQSKATRGRNWRNIGLLAAIAVVVAGALGIWQFYMRRPTIAPASVEKLAYPLPAKPSIAVLPFFNMSDDPNQEYFSDAISEDIITDLSKISGLIVIARNSSFTYKGKSVNVQQIGQDLNVHYLLKGSVRKAGDQVRINT
jgi:hypothetical protein